jgi:MtrB/PioB family decaheme-associated outer membrane protein
MRSFARLRARVARVAVIAVAGCAAGAAAAAAQAPSSRASAEAGANVFELIGRATVPVGESDEGRFRRYRDLRDGGTLDLFRYGAETPNASFRASADHVAFRDQRYTVSYNRFGKLKAFFRWDQVPQVYSSRAATVFDASRPGVLRASATAAPLDLRTRRDLLDLAATYAIRPRLDLTLAFKSTGRSGAQPWAGTFGFGNAVELAAPLDTRTTELGSALEWSGIRGLARAAYDASFFRNDIETLIWDNPLRVASPTAGGPLEGRMTMWPDSDMNAASVMGALNLPRRSSAAAYVSVGRWSQNAALLPFTVNPALTPVPLDRPTADARAVVTAMAYSFTSKPAQRWWLSARYRLYDFDNRTPVFRVAQTVAYDTSPAAFPHGGTSPYAFTRRTVDLDASFTPAPFTALRAAYTREHVDQTFRTFDTTVEQTVRLSADATRAGWLTLRGVYEHARRTGSGLDEQALDDIGEQTSLRQFDISDRTSDRVSGVVQAVPFPQLSLTGSVSAGEEDRAGTVFGLRSSGSRSYSAGFDYVPREEVSMSVTYTVERFNALQASRQANPGPQFADPSRDWTTDSADRARTLTAAIDVIDLWPRTDVRVGYDVSYARSIYVYGLPANTSLPPIVQLPPVVNRLQRATADVRYQLGSRMAAGLAYGFDRYRVEDFALGEETLTGLAQPAFLTIGYLWRPYTVHTMTGRLTYFW